MTMNWLLSLALLAAPARGAIITGADYGGANLTPANGDFLTGTFTNVGIFDVGVGTTATVIQGLPLAIYASTITIRGTLQGTGRGASGGAGGAVASSGQSGSAADSGSTGGGGAGSTAATPKGGGGGGGGAAGGSGAGSSAGAGGLGYGSTGYMTSPISSDDLVMGSGGGGGAGNASLQGGGGANGGAAIFLEAASMTVTGSILVSGDTATAVSDGNIVVGPHPAGGGGGGGGTILLRIRGALNLYGAALAANGGGGGDVDSIAGGTLDPGGGGGGGRVKLFSKSRNVISVTISTAAGSYGLKGSGFSGSTDTAAPGLSSGTVGAASFGTVASSPTSVGFSSVYVTSISWTWSGSASFGDAPAASDLFRVFAGTSTPPFPSPQKTATSLATGTTEQGLTPNTTYSRFVTAFSDWGDSEPSTVVSTYTLADTPGAGAPSFTSMADVSLTLNWTSGANGNPSYTQYEIDRSTSSLFAAPVSTSFVVGLSSSPSGLTPNTSYYFRVRALNLASIPTAFAGTVTTATLASLPSGLGFSGVFVTSAVFTWSGGANPSDTPYRAEVSTDNFFSTNASSATFNASATFTGLTPGVVYFFRVTAINRNGVLTGPTAATTATPGNLTNTNPPTGPGSPTADRTFSNDGTAGYSWTAGASPVGILDYNLQIGTVPGASDFLDVSTTSLSYAVAGLASGKTYFAQVRARTNAGVYGTFAQNPTGLPVFIPSAQQAVGKPYGWPMPFDPATGSLQIAFSLDSAGVVLFRVFTLEGRRVRELSQGFAAAGNQILSWDGTNDAGQKVSPGGYVGLITSPSGARQKFKIAVSPR